ncbi:hypothetical protein GW17_00030562 [Ensete ventricosum]|nr:hypothetical protein GW17_00030562 [Ensete ventricosum]
MEKNVLVVVGEEDKSREYRKGNWTMDETMVLIQARKMDYERRAQRPEPLLPRGSSSRPQEMRWKWVEDRCWGHGCYRSQNQCNDRWDNLMRDYKKVRAYETSSSIGGNPDLSYWNLEKNDRKERNLPSNVLPEVYEALTEVAQRKRSGGASAAPARRTEEKRECGPGAGSQAPPHARPVTTTGEKQEEVRHKDLISAERRKAKLEESKSVMGFAVHGWVGCCHQQACQLNPWFSHWQGAEEAPEQMNKNMAINVDSPLAYLWNHWRIPHL